MPLPAALNWCVFADLPIPLYFIKDLIPQLSICMYVLAANLLCYVASIALRWQEAPPSRKSSQRRRPRLIDSCVLSTSCTTAVYDTQCSTV